jgi:DNA-binding transcriptional LysR family regulator
MAQHIPNLAALDQASILSLRIFIAVAEAQSFSSAARQLRLSPSVATNHILALERAMGTALFHRTTRRVAITDAGERFYRRCTAILREIDLSLTAAPDAQRGHLRVTAPPSFGLTALGPNLAAFLARQPYISVDLMVTSAVPNMISERIDLMFVLREELDSKLPHLRIAPSGRAFCAAPEYLSRHGTPATPADLARHQCLANMVAGTAERWTVKAGRTRRQIRVPAQLLADNGEVLRLACLNGAGIGNFYRFHVREDLAAGRLIEVLAGYQPHSNFIYAVTPHREMMLPPVQLFIEFVRSVVTESPLRDERDVLQDELLAEALP